jgi:hypothetical protein
VPAATIKKYEEFRAQQKANSQSTENFKFGDILPQDKENSQKSGKREMENIDDGNATATDDDIDDE